ncbi:MAG: flavodoxin family protein [Collinsella sp.]|nr:flavodoxin family protein [Collinsella sp.]
MSCVIIVNSAGGNTRQVAEAIKAEMTSRGRDADLVILGAANVEEAIACASRADELAIGFWCDKGTCTAPVDKLLASLGDQRVFLFGTAGFGGSEEYFERILSGVSAKLPEGVRYEGGAMCQGKMSPAVRRRYEAMLAEKPEDEHILAMIDNYDAAASHPDAGDLARVATAACEALLK